MLRLALGIRLENAYSGALYPTAAAPTNIITLPPTVPACTLIDGIPLFWSACTAKLVGLVSHRKRLSYAQPPRESWVRNGISMLWQSLCSD
jgi:hypothetical protein